MREACRSISDVEFCVLHVIGFIIGVAVVWPAGLWFYSQRGQRPESQEPPAPELPALPCIRSVRAEALR